MRVQGLVLGLRSRGLTHESVVIQEEVVLLSEPAWKACDAGVG